MANVGSALKLPFVVGAGAIVGQGNLPILDVYISFSDLSDPTPDWTWISPNKIRSFSVSRTEGETGTATLVLDNRDRAYDSTVNAGVRPMNQVWLREQFTGDTNDMYKGYAESYEMEWPGGGWSDAVVVVKTADEFKILSLMTLPLMNPPRATYQDLVAYDNPDVYWPMDSPAAARIQPPAPAYTPPEVYEDKFELGELSKKAPTRKHVKKPVGRKTPTKHPKGWHRHFDKPDPPKRSKPKKRRR
jgi:hypothetical protein